MVYLLWCTSPRPSCMRGYCLVRAVLTLAENPPPPGRPQVALSAIGLAFNFLANVLLVIRFSPISHRWWGRATTASTIFWTVKTIVSLDLVGRGLEHDPSFPLSVRLQVAIVNLCLFGIWSRNGPGCKSLLRAKVDSSAESSIRCIYGRLLV
jgi:hypothetical protein